ncbi:SDR family NAD(P)-dependent oxidoreductase [Haliea sp. E17]|uniref:SDR family NAD(P)-dependent oxidoreductase n=1 Tax=Haliea sp. E17 TaxID=3401576 RepID=UPI003AADB6E8
MSDDIALVTGASSGLGEAFCRALASRCKRIIAVARRGAALEALAAELAGEVEVIPVVADLASIEGNARTLEALRQRGPVSILVNNAGFGALGPFAESAITAQQAMVSVHIDATINLCRAALPFMREQGGGYIINVGSVLALAPLPGTAVYSATKAFLANFSAVLQEEERPHGIRVQCLCPGLTRTGFHEAEGFSGSGPGEFPEAMWMQPDAVVAHSLAALAHEEVIVVPGEVNQQMAREALQRQLDLV